jgi:hypothetical protein
MKVDDYEFNLCIIEFDVTEILEHLATLGVVM